MAFDTSTRNRLNKFVGDARALITEEFTNQCQVDYGIDPDTGEVADLERLTHLDDARRQTAIILRETLSHYYANLPNKNKKKEADHKQLIERIIREQAFTILNRLCAIRMAEARDLVIESVAAGMQSKGFQLYQPVVGNSLGDTAAAYQQYLFSLFDEFAADLPVLFDRFSPQGRLFPRESVLVELLDLINGAEINQLWTEDEAIGWIYQYFNSKEERKAMRDASQAPRNSRELAVRNQFFTPRYVVEFLTDNTLGRIWYEMRKGETRLKDECQYLVRRPKEIFLAEGEEAPEMESNEEKDLTQEELLNQPVHIPHRPLKDPREIRMLDPACGSMHFGLYAFDLYLKIYEEFWVLVTSDPSVAIEPTDLPPMVEGYESRDAFLRDVPKLIIEHNIHGIDIDPRAVQIAGLSLWLRAQRAWKSQGLAAVDRPQITRSNVVCAEPMPGDRQQLEAFCKQLHPAIAQMVTAIFEEMKLAGEAGSLLKIEQEISSLVAAAKKQFQDNPPDKKTQMQLFGGAQTPKEQQLEFDLSGITDVQFFEKAEEEIYEALRKYASETSEGGFRRKLFANDAEKGFAFVDKSFTKFDIALMNPPFGDVSLPTKKYVSSQYRSCKDDIDAMFVHRGLELLVDEGFVGAIVNRTQFFKGSLRTWRDNDLLGQSNIDAAADLGHGVLDGALVEACSYVLRKPLLESQSSAFIRLLREKDKSRKLAPAISSIRDGIAFDDVFIASPDDFRKLPESRISYWASPSFRRAYKRFQSLEGNNGFARTGLQTGDNFRFLRLAWEVDPSDIIHSRDESMNRTSPNAWVYYAKGGEYSPYFADIHLLVDWNQDGYSIRNHFSSNGKLASRPQNRDFYFKPAITYTERTASGFSPRALPNGCIFDVKGPVVSPVDADQTLSLLAITMSRVFANFVEFSVASGDAAVSGSAARQYTQGIIGGVPVAGLSKKCRDQLEELATKIWLAKAAEDSEKETSRYFLAPSVVISEVLSDNSHLNIRELVELSIERREDRELQVIECSRKIESLVRDAYKLDELALEQIDNEFGTHPDLLDASDLTSEEVDEFLGDYVRPTEEIIDELVQCGGGSRSITKKLYFSNRRLELLSSKLQRHPRALVKARRTNGIDSDGIVLAHAKALIHFALGCFWERWNIARLSSVDLLNPPISPSEPILPIPPIGLFDAKNDKDEKRFQMESVTILVDDPTHQHDLVGGIQQALRLIFNEQAEEIEAECCSILSVNSLREFIRKESASGFFEYHIETYSASRRSAPIYWPISTESGSYTLWFYYHSLTDQTLYKAVNDFVDPKLKETGRQLADLRAIKDRSSDQEKELAQLTELESELEQFKADLLEIAAFWKPNLNDGVQITAAPLWKFFRLTKWRNKLKNTWEELQDGKYDWAHLALSIWPDRVVREKCTTDRSIAIAHDLEDQLWHEVEIQKTSKSGRVTTKMEWQPRNLTDAELDAIVEAIKSGKHTIRQNEVTA